MRPEKFLPLHLLWGTDTGLEGGLYVADGSPGHLPGAPCIAQAVWLGAGAGGRRELTPVASSSHNSHQGAAAASTLNAHWVSRQDRRKPLCCWEKLESLQTEEVAAAF